MTTTSHLVGLSGATDEQIVDALDHADPIVLRALLYQLTGDEVVSNVRVDRAHFYSYESPHVVSDRDVEMLKAKALEFLKAHRDAGFPEIQIDRARLPMTVCLAAGKEVSPEGVELHLEELGLDRWAREHKWSEDPDPGRLAAFSVTVIGAGMAGLNAAVMLKRAGIPYRHFEKDSDVGGTWWETRYPGSRIDTPSRAYNHIFGFDFDYPYEYCPSTENHKYFTWVADTFELREKISFNTEVVSMSWDDEASMWEIETDGPEGRKVHRSNAVITAVGFLNRPKVPEIEGQDEYEGRSWHTSRWPADVDVSGSRVAVIGTGATGYQLAHGLAQQAEQVYMFQRTPSWMYEVPGYLAENPPQVRWLNQNFPFYMNFMRMTIHIAMGEGFETPTEVDPDFADPHTVSAFNMGMRQDAISFLERRLSDPGTVKAMTPEHPPWSSRPVIVDSESSVLDALEAGTVSLVTGGVRSMNARGIEGRDGTQYDVDYIVYATGFHATEYLYPMQITGRDGQSLDEYWAKGGARAYNLAMVPGFPNLWSLYGPNTNGGSSPSVMHELVTRYALQCMEPLILEEKSSIEVTETAYWRFAGEVDDRNARKIWSDPRANNYYWTDKGRSSTQCPFTPGELNQFLRRPDWDDLALW